MDKLKAEIARKKAQAEAIRQASASLGSASEENDMKDRKFFRLRDREVFEQQQLEDRQKQLDEERVERKRKQEEEVAHRKAPEDSADSRTSSSVTVGPVVGTTSEPINLREKFSYIQHLTVPETKNQLRRLRSAVSLFGESDQDRSERLLYLSVASELRNGTQGFTGYEEIMSRGNAVDSSGISAGVDGEHSDEEDSSDDRSDSKRARRQHTTDTSRPTVEGLYFDPSNPFHSQEGLSQEKIVLKFFKSLVKQWDWDLQQRTDIEKASAKGREETRTQKQCKEYVRPLFRLCKRKEVPPDILYKLHLMVQHCEEGDFVKANDEYMRTAIGNAAWPMGLTMVGIHDRSGREKISTSKIAHIMNNEQERKYLTSVKRLMTFAQSKRPDIAPSRKVL